MNLRRGSVARRLPAEHHLRGECPAHQLIGANSVTMWQLRAYPRAKRPCGIPRVARTLPVIAAKTQKKTTKPERYK